MAPSENVTAAAPDRRPRWLVRAVAGAPVTAFLIGTFAWAWLLWGYWIPTMPPGGLEISLPFVLCAIGGGFAPSLSALAVAWLIGGRRQVRELLRPLASWRHPLHWYAVALLVVPATAIVSAALQTALIGPLRWPDPGLVAMALVWPLLAAVGEEVGWRGFLQPRLQARLGILGAALVIGVIWGLWHLPADYIGLKGYGDWFVLAFLVNGPVVLTAHAVIMAWLWNRTGGSLPIAVLYHMSITASAMLAPAAGSEGPTGVASSAIGAALLWAVALYLVLARPADFRPAASAPAAPSSSA